MTEPQPDMIVVGTLNIRNRSDRWKERAPLLIEQLDELQPDVIGLQEIRRPLGQGGWLRREVNRGLPPELPIYGLETAWKTGWWRCWEGLGVLTRLPVVDAAWLDLRGGSRVAQRVRLRLADGRTLAFYNTHLHHLPLDDSVRLAQARRIVGWIDRAPNELHVVVGDFNAEPESSVERFMAARFVSAYRAVHGAEPELTAPTPLNRTEASRVATIDYIFLDPRLTVQDAWLTFTRPALGDERLYPSDHFGIAARIVLPE